MIAAKIAATVGVAMGVVALTVRWTNTSITRAVQAPWKS